ncbi:MAG TPA: serine hydrolase [Panacibacter sp.]|nr:serine hydrolase [Panacibacter sp.]
MNKIFLAIIFVLIFTSANAQTNNSFADSIRIKYHIPELAYAVISSDSVFEIQALGFQRINTKFKATLSDRFRIGSNTKTVTSYIAALLVKQGKIKWETKFLDLYPELKIKSNPAYYNFTLQDFLTFRANLVGWSYGNDAPSKKEIKGNAQQQRYNFVLWILQQQPDTVKKTVYRSNASYVAAGLMLEKVTGKDYETLVHELGKELDIDFDFGQPNYRDRNQSWGHDDNLTPEKPASNYKLNWLSSAGNINVSLPGYIKFIQLQLKGLLGKSNIFSAEEFNFMHYGLPEFSFGWKTYTDETNNLKYSFHEGNPGTFLSRIYICKNTNRAFIFFANVQSDDAAEGLTILFNELSKEGNYTLR